MKPQDHILAVPNCSYWLVLCDHGPRIGIGLSLNSGDPEMTRRQIVDEVRECIAKDMAIIHVRHIVGTDMEDLTHEIVSEALYQLEHEAA